MALQHHLQDWKLFAHLRSTSNLMLRRKVTKWNNQNCWIAFSINLTVWVEELGTLETAKLQEANDFTILVLNYLTFVTSK